MKTKLPLLALALAAFGIGTTEFVMMGLLPEVAADLQVSIPRARLLISGYAMGVAMGGPLMAAATAHLPRKGTLAGGLGLTVGNLIGARLADWRLMPSLAGIFLALAIGPRTGRTAFVDGRFVPGV